MKLLSLSVGHDASLCLYDSREQFFQYIKAEREMDSKHCGYDLGFIRRMLAEYSFTPDAFAVDWADNEGSLRGELAQVSLDEAGPGLGLSVRKVKRHNKRVSALRGAFPGVPAYWVSHHYAHILSAWLGFGTDFEYGVAVDGLSHNQDATAFFANPFDDTAGMIYRSKSRDHNVSSYGRFFRFVGEAMGLEGMPVDFAGKVMGAHAYGSADLAHINSQDSQYLKECICEYVRREIDYFEGERSIDNPRWLDWIATKHKLWENTLEALISDYIPRNAKVAFSGGAIQNTVLNERLAALYPNGVFVPHCYDGGLSIGVMADLCRRYDIPLPRVESYPYLQRDHVLGEPGPELIRDAAERLAAGQIVGWHQGRGEIGPRALGNRSILMNPAIPEAKSIINERVKHREFWRPYAASVIEDKAADWFLTDTPSRFMMRAVPVIPERAGQIPAVVHKDGTCRIQTVTSESNPLFHSLLQAFYELTGIPILLNTSLNDGGKPTSGSADSSLRVLSGSDMDALYIGDYLVAARR